MIDLKKYSSAKYFLFGSLYFSEGLIRAINIVILPVYFLEKGISPELITLIIGLVTAPMIVKFFWGGIVDYFIRFGRKQFIILGGFLTIISLFLLPFVDPEYGLIFFAILLFITWTGIGFLDVSADAWAIDISREKERGKINGAMFAGQNIGVACGAIILPFISEKFSYEAVFSMTAILVLLIIIFPMVTKDTKIVKTSQKVGRILVNEFKKKTTLLVAFFGFLLAVPIGLLILIAPIYMNINLHLDVTQVGLITMVFTLSTAIGALVGGALTDKWSRKNSLYLFIGLSIIFTAMLIFSNNWQNFTFVFSVIGFLQGGFFASFMAMCMDITNPRVGATQFSIFTGLGNFGMLGLMMISGTMFVLLGPFRLFLYTSLLFGPSLIVLYYIRYKMKSQTTQ
jgi:MFS family permease